MSKIHHAPSAASIIARLSKLGLEAHVGTWGCQAIIKDSVTVQIEPVRGQWTNKRDYTLSAKYTDAKSHSKRAWIKFSLTDSTDGPKDAWSDTCKYDREISDELWTKFEPKLLAAIETHKFEMKKRAARNKRRDEYWKRDGEQNKWLQTNAPSFSLRERDITFSFDPDKFDEMKERLKAAHAILFPA